MSDKGMAWSFFGIWNDSLLKRADRELKNRDYIWASELGGSMIDRYLRMKATVPSNPPNARSLRKFEAGNIWEGILELILKRAGILLDSQEWLPYQYEGLLKVTGRLDFIAGGSPDWEKARASMEDIKIMLPETVYRATLAIIDQLQAKYPSELKKIVLECKSVSSFMFDRYEATGKGNPHHEMQLFHYLKAKNMDEGHIVYVCKDDCRMLEIGVFNPSDVEMAYYKDIEKMTEFIRTDTKPEIEKEILFDELTGKFQKNWKVEYSNYLTMLYGYKEPEAYRERWDRTVASFNRTFKRVLDGANMTKLNLDTIEEIKAYFPDYDRLVQVGADLKKEGVINGEEGGDLS